MSRIVIHVDPHVAGQTWRLQHPDGFWLGPTPYGYGLTWYQSEGRSDYEYVVAWPAPHDPVRFEWNGDEYVFALEGAGEAAIAEARVADVKQGMSLG